MTYLRNFWTDEQGQDLIEYSLLMAFVALASAALFLGEAITARKLAGLGLSLAAIIIFFIGSRTDASAASARGSRALRRKSILFALLACI